MLEEFRVDNFKSLINVTFRPKKDNLLLGVNNAGKTNLCQALAFLSATARWPLDTCANFTAGGLVGIPNYYFAKDTIDFFVKASVPFEAEELTFTYALTISVHTSSTSPPTLAVETEQSRVSGGGFDDVTLLENTRKGVRLLNESDHLRGHQTYVDTSAPREATMLSRLYDLQTNPRANCFKKYISSWQYYSLSPEAMRTGSVRHHPNDVVLRPHGENLASVIYQLKTSDERQYRKILKRLQVMAPKLELINFFVPSEDTIVMILEDNLGNREYAQNMSSGTLRFLGLLYVLSAQPFLMSHPLILVEEPENGICVGFLRELLDMLEEEPWGPQVIFTSHSPYFIDLFDNRLEGVFVLNRGEQHSSITQPDVQKVKTRLEKFPLGEQHFRDMLR